MSCHRRVGSLYQGRFKGILVEDDSHAAELSRYLHLNPVRANMVALPEEYRWSSYRSYRYAREAKKAPAWLDWETILQEHSKNVVNARRCYQRFIEAGIAEPPVSPLKSAVGGTFLGNALWIEKIREQLAREPEDINIPTRRQFMWRPEPSGILKVVRDHFKVPESSFVQTRKHGNDARSAAIYLVRRLTAQPVAANAETFGGVSLSAISISVKRSELRRSEDAAWNRLLAKLEKRCQNLNVKT